VTSLLVYCSCSLPVWTKAHLDRFAYRGIMRLTSERTAMCCAFFSILSKGTFPIIRHLHPFIFKDIYTYIISIPHAQLALNGQTMVSISLFLDRQICLKWLVCGHCVIPIDMLRSVRAEDVIFMFITGRVHD